MAHKLIGSHTVEESTKIFSERSKARDELTAKRRAANLVSRNTIQDAPDTSTNRGLPQPKAKVKKPKKKRVIKVDPNVKPIGRSVLPVAAVVDSLKSAFERFKSGAKAGASKGKQVAKAGAAKVKAAAQKAAAKPGERTVVPLTAKPSRNPFVKNTKENVKVTPLKGFEKLADEQGVPQSQSFAKARGVKVGDRGPLLNALAKRKAAQNRRLGLGGSRADRSRGGRERPPSAPGDARTPEQKSRLLKKKRRPDKNAKPSNIAGRVAGGIGGAAIGVAAARRFK